jgi:hypothetical protein
MCEVKVVCEPLCCDRGCRRGFQRIWFFSSPRVAQAAAASQPSLSQLFRTHAASTVDASINAVDSMWAVSVRQASSKAVAVVSQQLLRDLLDMSEQHVKYHVHTQSAMLIEVRQLVCLTLHIVFSWRWSCCVWRVWCVTRRCCSRCWTHMPHSQRALDRLEAALATVSNAEVQPAALQHAIGVVTGAVHVFLQRLTKQSQSYVHPETPASDPGGLQCSHTSLFVCTRVVSLLDADVSQFYGVAAKSAMVTSMQVSHDAIQRLMAQREGELERIKAFEEGIKRAVHAAMPCSESQLKAAIDACVVQGEALTLPAGSTTLSSNVVCFRRSILCCGFV